MIHYCVKFSKINYVPANWQWWYTILSRFFPGFVFSSFCSAYFVYVLIESNFIQNNCFWFVHLIIQNNESINILIWFNDHIFFFTFWFAPSWRCLIKPLHPNNFQGGSPWATLIPNSVIVVWVPYCVQLFLGMNIFQMYFLLSFAIAFVS